MTEMERSESGVEKKMSSAPSGIGRRAVLTSRSLLWTLALGVIFLFFVGLSSDAQVDSKKSGSLERRIADLEQEIAILRIMVDFDHTDTLPENLVLCDKKIPLTRDDIRERFEREYFQLLENRGLMAVLVKRYLKYAGLINGEIQKMALPSDLIYLVVAESYLNPRAVSNANAAGLWQFMKETGKREGLQIDDSVDERYNVKRSTKAALGHLRKLYNEFGDWFVVMAAYNAGRGRLREAIDNQGTRDFLDLYLPEETERYVFRIMAVKEIISSRERYGIRLYEKELYKPVTVSEVSIEAVREVPVLALARYTDLSYKGFRDLNLHLRKYRLPKGTYNINVPYEKLDLFLKRAKDSAYITVR
ncbi:MAG: Membrane-bound lytic murein transglycosylase D precursor [Syntrophorhabdus sp. PtaU1.Bin050]|nr:MAG: Membrane-bound lytic murein transglycosylase D precursor [Syntrophorhabdus sp. PtaU1.Bin050]